MQARHRTKRKAAAALLAACVAFAGHAALACGYHDQSAMARGLMNLAFPKSLYVGTAVWQAQNSGVLPPRSRKPAKDLFTYQRTVSDVQKLGSRLATPDSVRAPFSVVLLRSMLWTRFVPSPDGYDAAVHIKGPKRGDAVLVTEAEVIKALLNGTIDIKMAEKHGLFRLYGPMSRQAEIREALSGLAADRSAASLGKAN